MRNYIEEHHSLQIELFAKHKFNEQMGWESAPVCEFFTRPLVRHARGLSYTFSGLPG